MNVSSYCLWTTEVSSGLSTHSTIFTLVFSVSLCVRRQPQTTRMTRWRRLRLRVRWWRSGTGFRSRVGGLDVFRRFCSLKTFRTPTHCSRTPWHALWHQTLLSFCPPSLSLSLLLSFPSLPHLSISSFLLSYSPLSSSTSMFSLTSTSYL